MNREAREEQIELGKDGKGKIMTLVWGSLNLIQQNPRESSKSRLCFQGRMLCNTCSSGNGLFSAN